MAYLNDRKQCCCLLLLLFLCTCVRAHKVIWQRNSARLQNPSR